MISQAKPVLAAAGLEPLGPVPWLMPIQCVQTGVYVVELQEPLPEAPVDEFVVGDWLRRVPTLALDTRRPTAGQLADRLRAFWIPSRTVVYIGCTTRPLRDRVGEFYATPLGARSPHGGGRWIKTLRDLERCLVWWAVETTDPEAAERDLLRRFAASVPAREKDALFDRRHVLPFANLKDIDGRRKAHGITRPAS